MSIRWLLGLFWVAASVGAAAQTFISPTNHLWRYFATGAAPELGWASPTYDDSSWPEGRGLFGNELNYPHPIGTFIAAPSQGGPATAYFRTRFTWNGPLNSVTLSGTNFVDDGCVVYLNGVEISRFNMPAGEPTHSTLALAANPGGYPNLTGGEPVMVLTHIELSNLTNGNSNPLLAGTNVLAVEVHNNTQFSSDILFGMSLQAKIDDWFLCHDLQTPTNRTVIEGRTTTFRFNGADECVPRPTLQWYRDVGQGEELIPGATASTYTLTHALRGMDDGAYYCRSTVPSGTVHSRLALLTILPDHSPPQFLSASVGAGFNKFRLVTDEPLCADVAACGGDFRSEFDWEIAPLESSSNPLQVLNVIQIAPTIYEFTTAEARSPQKLYTITFTGLFGQVSDLFGNFVIPGTVITTSPSATFRQGVAGYLDTHDAEIHSLNFASTPLGLLAEMSADLDDGGAAQSLLRFDNIFGFTTNQVPPGTTIRSATLRLHQLDSGSAIRLHRMLIPWDQSTVTWDSMNGGIAPDDVKALSSFDATQAAGASNGPIEIDVTTSVRAWINGQPNHGWALLSTGGNGWSVSTSESGPATAPELTVEYEHSDNCVLSIATQPPPAITASEGASVAFAVQMHGSFGVVYQWTKNGVDIPGANQPIYLIPSASSLDAGTYRLRISCEHDPDGSILSEPCQLTVGHNERPYLTRATTSADNITITLGFSERLDETSAENLTNYTFTPALAVISAVLSNDASPPTVTLTTAPRDPGSRYTLRIVDLDDLSLSTGLITPNPTLVPLTTARVVLPWTADAWRYHTNNLDAVSGWHQPSFIPGPDWATGRGLFGAENSQAPLLAAPAAIATPLLPNNQPESPDNRVTTYFRREVSLPPLEPGTSYFIRHFADDGFIAYLDGVEIHRFAMPAGAVRFATRSKGIPTGDATLRSFPFEAAPGTHTLAVELHQAGVNSSDVLFGMEISIVNGPVPALSIHHAGPGLVHLRWSSDDTWQLRAADSAEGPYLDAPIQPFTPLGHFTIPTPATGNTNQFFRLDYVGPRH